MFTPTASAAPLRQSAASSRHCHLVEHLHILTTQVRLVLLLCETAPLWPRSTLLLILSSPDHGLTRAVAFLPSFQPSRRTLEGFRNGSGLLADIHSLAVDARHASK